MRLKGILVVAAGLTTLSCFTINAKAAAIDNYANANNTEIGGSVDIVNDGLNNSKSNIFTDEYRFLLQKKSLKNLKIKNKASESYITSSNRKKIINDVYCHFKDDFSTNAVVDGTDIFGLSSFISENELSISDDVTYAYSYYGYYNSKYELNVNEDDLSPEVLLDNDAYSSTFISELNELNKNNNYDSYSNFFKKYGTHILSDVLMGGKFEIVATYYSNDYSFSKKQIDSIGTSFEATINSLKSINTVNVEFTSANNLSNAIDYFRMQGKTIGGNSSSAINFTLDEGNVSKKTNVLNSWISSLQDYSQSAVVGIGGNGLVPIWNIIPDNFSNAKNNLMYYFGDYSNNKTSQVDDVYNSLGRGKLPKQLVRAEEVKITDKGRIYQPMDAINPSSIEGLLPTKEYLKAGYNYCHVTIELEYKIIDLGDQHFYIYSKSPNANDLNDGLIGHWKNSSSSNNWTKRVIKFDLAIYEQSFDNFMIVYSASGTWTDDWKNRNVFITITFN